MCLNVPTIVFSPKFVSEELWNRLAEISCSAVASFAYCHQMIVCTFSCLCSDCVCVCVSVCVCVCVCLCLCVSVCVCVCPQHLCCYCSLLHFPSISFVLYICILTYFLWYIKIEFCLSSWLFINWLISCMIRIVSLLPVHCCVLTLWIALQTCCFSYLWLL